jgi:hypothetical protein
MLTNAIKHGRKDHPVLIERHWPEASWEGDLRIETRNTMEPDGRTTVPMSTVRLPRAPGPDSAQPGPAPTGQGLEGMRRRLESVGGKLDVRRRDSLDGPVFTATAWVPARRSELRGER